MRKLLLALALIWSLPAKADILISQPNGLNAIVSATPAGATPTTPQTINVICPTCSGGGGGGTPGGSTGQTQYNAGSGNFGGITGATTDGITLTLVAPVLGTPTSGVATNLTGTASGLTAGNVTTNANLTGDITSVGNATTLITTQTGVHTWSAAQTYSGGEINSTSPSASNSAKIFSGTFLTGGSGTTNFPHLFIQPTGTTAGTTWNVSGTALGVNAVGAFAGNFLDFRSGGTNVFTMNVAGTLATSQYILSGTSGNLSLLNGTSQLAITNVGATTGILTSNGTNVISIGAKDAASPAAQGLSVQNVVAGTSNVAGQTFTVTGSRSTGSGVSGDVIISTGGTGAGATSQNAAVAALTVKGATQEVRLPQIASDATLTDTTVCQDTTNHGLRSGSGALGVCLGTSGRQFKTAFTPMTAGLDEIMKIKLWNYRYKQGHGDNGARLQYGPTAQDVEAVLPDLAGHDAEGETINYDWGAFIPITLRAIQQLKTDNDNLRSELRTLKTGAR